MHKGLRILITCAVAVVAVVGVVAYQRTTGGAQSGALTGAVGTGAVLLAWILSGKRLSE